MKKVKFQKFVADILEYDNPDSLDLTNPINGEEGWDSLALLGFLAMIETEYGLSMTAEDIDISASWENFFELFLANLDE